MANTGVPTQRLREEVHIGQCQVPARWHGTSIRLSTDYFLYYFLCIVRNTNNMANYNLNRVAV